MQEKLLAGSTIQPHKFSSQKSIFDGWNDFHGHCMVQKYTFLVKETCLGE